MFEKGIKSKPTISTDVLQNLFKAIDPLEKVGGFSFITITWQLALFTMMLIRQNIRTLKFGQTMRNLITENSDLRQFAFWGLVGISTLATSALLSAAFFRQHLRKVDKVLTFLCAFLHFNCILMNLSSLSVITASKNLANICIYITTLPLQTLFLYIQPHFHLFGVFSILIPVSEALFPIQICKWLFLAVVIYSCKEVATLHQKRGWMVLFIVAVWSICFPNISNPNPLELLYLVIPAIGIAMVAGVLELTETRQNDDEMLLKMACRVEGLNDEINLAMKEKVWLLGLVQAGDKGLTDFNKVQQLEQAILANKMKKEDLLFLLESKSVAKNLYSLEAEIEIIRKNKGIKLSKLINRIQPHSLQQLFQLQRIKAKAEDLYRADANAKIDGRFIQQINLEIESFYQHIYRGVQKLITFWSDASAPKVNLPVISRQIQKVMDCHWEAQKCLQRLSGLYPSKIQQKILKGFQQLYNHYTHEEQPKQPVHPDDEQNYDYLVLTNGKVQKVSARLMAELNISKEDKSGSSELSVIPAAILRRISDSVDQYLDNDFLVPVLVGSSMVVKRARMCLIPSYDQHIKYLIILKNASADYSFIYDRANNQMILLSSKLLELLKKIDHPADLRSIPHQILNIDIAEAAEELKKQRKISLNTLGTRVADSNQNHRAHLHLLTTFGKNDRELMLLELKRVKQIRHRARGGQVQFDQSVQIDSTNAKRLIVYKQEKHFCKIKNTYGNVIVEKIQNADRINSINNPCWVGILFCSLVVLLVVTLGLLVFFSGQRHTDYCNIIGQGSSLSIQYHNLVTISYESHIRYFIKRYSKQVLDWNPELNATEMISYYSNSITSLIANTLVEQIDNQFQLHKTQINYSIDYKRFNFSGNTHHPDIIFFLQQAKKSIKTFNTTFLINNYHTLRNLRQAYALQSIVIPQIKALHNAELIIVAVIFSLCCFLLIAMGVIIIVTEKTVFNSIYNYLQKVTAKQYLKTLNKILKYLKRQSILSYCDNLYEQACSQRIQATINKLRAQEYHQNRHFYQESIFKGLLRSHMLFIFLLALLTSGLLYKHSVEDELGEFIGIIGCLQALQRTSEHITNQMTDVISAASQRELYGSATLYGLSNIVNMSSQVSMNNLPSFFDDFKLQFRTTLLGNLCLSSSIIQNITFISSVSCKDIYGGALLKGYSVAFESYRDSLVSIRNISGSQFLSIYRLSSVYPVSVEGLYYKEIVTRLFNQKIAELKKLTAQFSIKKKAQTNDILAVIFLSLGLICCLTIIAIAKFKQRCKTAFYILRSIPRSTLLSIKYSKQMIRDKFLASLERL